MRYACERLRWLRVLEGVHVLSLLDVAAYARIVRYFADGGLIREADRAQYETIRASTHQRLHASAAEVAIMKSVGAITAATILPFVPLLLLEVPAKQILQTLAKLVL